MVNARPFTATPRPIAEVFGTWELVALIVQPAAGPVRTKTYLHRRGEHVAVTRYLGGQLVGHIRMTADELQTLGGALSPA